MIRSALEYHNLTSYRRHSMSAHHMDWGSQPTVFKHYRGLTRISLPRDLSLPEMKLSDLFSDDLTAGHEPITLERLARVLVLTHCLTAKARYGGTDFYYRSVASAGALYPFELYVAPTGAPDLPPGLYHHDVQEQELAAVRAGDLRPELTAAVPIPEADPPALVFFLTSIFFRSSWKYRDRAYRYHLLDTGHLAENLALALTCEGLRHRYTYDFDDAAINSLLGVDPQREVCLAVALVWADGAEAREAFPLEPPAAGLAEMSRVSDREVDYPEIRELHEVSSIVSGLPASMPNQLGHLGLTLGERRDLPPSPSWPEVSGYSDAVFRRRSMRNFVRTPLKADLFQGLMAALCRDPGPGLSPPDSSRNAVTVGLLAGYVEGLNPGFYLLDRETASLRLSRAGIFMDEMAGIALDQAWLAGCALHVLFLTNFGILEGACGPRGYRHAMLTAGRLGQRIYLTATALRLGCCGIGAFYDDEAARLLGLNESSRLLYLVAAGRVKKWTA